MLTHLMKAHLMKEHTCHWQICQRNDVHTFPMGFSRGVVRNGCEEEVYRSLACGYVLHAKCTVVGAEPLQHQVIMYPSLLN
jgi:hypothetical protein